MKKLLALVLKRRLVTALGLAAIALLIWYVGPLIAVAGYRPLEPSRTRLVLIGLVALAAGGRTLARTLKARRANASLMDGLLKAPASAAGGANDVTAEELALLQKRFESAVAVLRKARLHGRGSSPGRWLAALGRQWVYELPWYILIGAPGSGKTTALVHSGLQFPLGEQFGRAAIQGVGGTRNCDWWFTNEAVLLDTAGRYTTQESNRKADSAAWTGFLQLLKKYRARRPINGVLLTLSVPDLLQQTPDERTAHIAALRQRLHELHEELDIRFPLYVLVTKTDLLAGFMDFFAEMGKDERAQIWGMTFPYAERDVAGAPDFAAQFAALEGRINARLIDRMQQERDPHKRAQIYLFPQQVATLKASLGEFVDALFADSRYTETPLLRGVYFTSGTQEGTPIDRMMHTLGRALHLDRKVLPPHTPGGKSFFITRLLKDLVFQEAGVAGTNLRRERRRALLQLALLTLATILTIGMLAAWAISYANNRAYVAAVESRLDALGTQVAALRRDRSADLVALLPTLRAVRDLVTPPAPAAADSVPMSMGFGLYQGDKLAGASRTAYQGLLRNVFLPRLDMRVQQQLQGAGTGNQELLYEALKAYIMLHDERHFDAAALKAFITADWENTLPRDVTVAQRRELEGHLDTLLGGAHVTSPRPADPQLVAGARAAVASTPLAARIYNRLKRAGVGADLPEFTVAGAAGPSAVLVLTRANKPLTSGVPGLYSVSGYRNAFVKEAGRVTNQLAEEEGWVLGLDEKDRRFRDPAQRASQLEEVRRLYLEDYARIWSAFVDDIKLLRPGNLQQSIQSARILSMPDSPLAALLRAIVKEVTLIPPAQDQSAIDKAGEKVRNTRDELMKLFGNDGDRPAATTATTVAPEHIVDDRFAELRRLVTSPGAGQPAPIDATTALINELYTLLTATEAALKGANTPPQSDVPTKVKAQGGLMPEPIRSILLTLAAGSASQALGVTRANLNQAMQASLGEFCNKAIAGRYPFTRGSARDVTQDDFSRLFAPGGMIDDFFQKNLAQFVNTSTRPWSFRFVGDATMGTTSNALLQFQRAQVIREVFFSKGSAAGMRLDLKPVMMDEAITQFTLDVDGQLVKYSHGPQVPAQVQWPGPRGSTQVRLQLSPPSATGASGRTFEGAWALFRLFDQVQIDATGQPEKFIATFNIEGRRTQFEVLTNSVRNPFRLAELEQFQCPGVL